MTQKEYDRMAKIYNYVYSTPANSPERAARLAELSEKDSAALYDFDMGLMSGRIKRPETKNKESEDNKMKPNIYTGKKEKIENYEDFKKALTRNGTYQTLLELKQSNPGIYQYYVERLEKEKARG